LSPVVDKCVAILHLVYEGVADDDVLTDLVPILPWADDIKTIV
jgi:hypothetical protein